MGAMKQPIYLDNHATTAVDPRVRDAMLPWLGPRFGNAGSTTHPYGWMAAEAVAAARQSVAGLLGCEPAEIVFTAGATEGCNMVLQGLAELHGRGRIITTALEHHAVLDTCEHLAKRGFEIEILPVDGQGLVDVSAVERALEAPALVISVMAANNEIGTIQPLAEIGRLAKSRSVIFHCDAAQAVGRIPLDVEALGIDLLTLSAHKFYGPQGIGALHVRARNPSVRLAPLLHGGGQERGLRPGTHAVPSIVALGAAADAVVADLDADRQRILGLRDGMEARLRAELAGVHVNGHPAHRLAGNLSVSFEGVEAEALMLAMPRVAFSAGSACTSEGISVSHVLRAIGLPPERARGTVRFGLGRFTTADEIREATDLVVAAVARLRAP